MRISGIGEPLPPYTAHIEGSAAQTIPNQDAQERNRVHEEAAVEQKLHDLVADVNKFVESRQVQLQFVLDSTSGRQLIQLIDRDTLKVLRQIPSEEMLAISRNIERLQGVTVDGVA